MKGSDMELFLAHVKENVTLQPLKRWNDAKILVQYSRVSVLRVVGTLKKKNNRDTIHFNADASNTELLFRIIHSVNQLSIYGAVSNWSEQFGLTEEAQEVKLLYLLQDYYQIRFTMVCELASFGHSVSAGMNYTTRPGEDDGRENMFSRVNTQSRAFAAIPGGKIIGPVIEVQIVKVLDQHGLEIANPSPKDTGRTSHFMISRGKSRFVDEVNIPNAELDSADLLTELQKADGE